MKRALWVLAIAAVLGGGFCGYARMRREALGPAPTAAAIARLVEEQRALRNELRALLDEHNVLDFAHAPPGNVLVGVPTSFTESLIGQMVTGLFAEVRLRLRDIKVRHEDDVKAKVLFSRRTLGHFVLEVDVKEIRALLKPAAPELTFGGDKIAIRQPVTLADGRGTANVHFRWQGKGIAGAVCGDLDVSPDVSSDVVPAVYTVKGEFLLAAAGDTVVARPRFKDVVLKVVLRPTEQTWATLESTVEEVKDDKNGLCGMAIKKLNVRSLVQRIIDKGFDVKLPPKLFRDISLPATVEQSVTYKDRTVSLDARPIGLRVTPFMLWYGVAMTAEGEGAASPAPPGRGPARQRSAVVIFP